MGNAHRASIDGMRRSRLLAQQNLHLTCNAERKILHTYWALFVGLLLFVNMFSFVTWNVRGLTRDFKRSLLADDCFRYGMDIVCLQETKCTMAEDILLHNNYRLIILEQKHCRHGGLGFVINPHMNDYIKSYSYISDPVAVFDLQVPTKSGIPINYRIVNAYGPTMQRASNEPQLLTSFYQTLSSAVKVPSRFELYIMGDFNSKLGKVTLDETVETNISDHVGRYAVGTRNSNGEHMLNFLFEHGLFACNTAF